MVDLICNLTSRRTVAKHPMPAARMSAVGSPSGAASTCAPHAISCRRTFVDPPALTDVKSGVQPFLSLAFTAAPASRNSRTISSLSCSHAMCTIVAGEVARTGGMARYKARSEDVKFSFQSSRGEKRPPAPLENNASTCFKLL